METTEMTKKKWKAVNKGRRKRAEMSLLDHLETIVSLTGKQGFTDSFFEKAKPHIKYAADTLKLTEIQTAIFAHFLNQYDDQSITMENLAGTINCGKLRLLKYMNEFEVLEKRKLIRCRRSVSDEYRGDDMPVYRVPRDVVMAVKDGKAFIPANNENLSPKKYFKILHSLFTQRRDGELSLESLLNEERDLTNANGHLVFVQKLKQYAFSADEAVIFLYFCDCLVNKDYETIGEDDLDFIFDDVFFDGNVSSFSWSQFRNQTHPFIKICLVENCDNGGFIDPDHFKLADKAKEEFLVEINLKEEPLKYGADYIMGSSIQEKNFSTMKKRQTEYGSYPCC
jgi:hypothetical protein